jgi:hypothetical protein
MKPITVKEQHQAGGMGCLVRQHLDLNDITKELLAGTPTLNRHIKNCPKLTATKLRYSYRISHVLDVDNRFNLLLNEAEEAFLAVNEDLVLDGELNYDSRAY